jgi:hypothetical protein
MDTGRMESFLRKKDDEKNDKKVLNDNFCLDKF